MDTSVQDLDAVSFVLGEGQPFVKWNDLSDEEKCKVVGSVVHKVRPLLAQMPGFKTLREQLLETGASGSASSLDDLKVSGNCDLNRRCRLLVPLGPTKNVQDAVIVAESLYTDQAGDWFVVTASYRVSNQNRIPLPWPFDVRSIDCDAGEIREIVLNNGRQVCRALHMTLSLAIKFWNRRIESCSGLKDWIGEINIRLV